MTEPKGTAMSKPSLAEYAKDHPASGSGNACWLCGIPERAEVEAAVTAGLAKSVALRWLREACGYGTQATVNKVDGHMKNHVSSTAR